MLDLAQLLFGDALGLDSFLLGKARAALGLTQAFLLGLLLSLGGQALRLLLGAKLSFGLLAVGALGDGQSAAHFDIDVSPGDFEQIISKGVDEAVEDPLNV
ncbi:MAG: hypothetical protein ABUL60_17880 [Myxococcales bacterium]